MNKTALAILAALSASIAISNPEDARVALEEKANPSQPITDTEELRMIEELCSEVAAFLRAATRKGRFFIAQYYVREMMEKTANLLCCRKLMDEEMPKKIALPTTAMKILLAPDDPLLKNKRVALRLTRPLLVASSESKRSSSSRRRA